MASHTCHPGQLVLETEVLRYHTVRGRHMERRGAAQQCWGRGAGGQGRQDVS